MRGGLVGHDVDQRSVPGLDPVEVALEQRRHQLGGVAQDADRERPPLLAGRQRPRHRVVEVVGLLVEVAGLDPAVDPVLVALDADHDPVVHGDGERLGAAHPAEAGGERDRPGEGAAEPLVGDRREGLEGPLQDPLGADVDPRPGGHLAVHRQPEVLEPAELLPVGPVADQVGVGDQDPRRPGVGLHHPDRLARLHQHRLVVAEGLQGPDQGVVRLPAAGGLAGAAVDDQVLRALGVGGVEVVHEHPQRGLGLPGAAAEVGPGGGVDGQARVGGHRTLLVRSTVTS